MNVQAVNDPQGFFDVQDSFNSIQDVGEAQNKTQLNFIHKAL